MIVAVYQTFGTEMITVGSVSTQQRTIVLSSLKIFMQISGTFAHAVFKISDKDTLRFYLEKDQSDSNWIQQAKFNGIFFQNRHGK